ncbi:agaA33 [Symbiodinium sp. CCMP2592]|nr:agaA33 [Symbiodinium sp. CCMP2592]
MLSHPVATRLAERISPAKSVSLRAACTGCAGVASCCRMQMPQVFWAMVASSADRSGHGCPDDAGPGTSAARPNLRSGRKLPPWGFLGTSMDAGSLLLLDTCGVAASADFGEPGRPGQPRGPTVAALLASGAAFRWEAEVPAAPSGGSFRLCWCVEKLPQNLTNYTSCAISSDFTVDMGMLHVMGPLAGDTQQQFTCVGGQRCTLSPIRGLDLLPGDRVLVMDTCGVQEMPADVSGTFGVGGLRNSVLVWDVEAAPLPGGQYRLCWCRSQSMSTSNHTSKVPADSKTDAGGVSILSPALHQHRTCVSEQTCSLDGITGNSLSPGDAITASDTCGAPSGVINILATAAVVSHSGAAARWDAAVVTAAGGIYRLCWCAGLRVEEGFTNSSSCRTPVGFTVDFGDLHLIGPNPLDATRTCISGPCVTAALEGFHLSVHDRFVILDTCGQRLAVVAGAGFGAPLGGQASNGTLAGGTIEWDTRVSGDVMGGQYRTCTLLGRLHC